jgi:hypothetical protein
MEDPPELAFLDQFAGAATGAKLACTSIQRLFCLT